MFFANQEGEIETMERFKRRKQLNHWESCTLVNMQSVDVSSPRAYAPAASFKSQRRLLYLSMAAVYHDISKAGKVSW